MGIIRNLLDGSANQTLWGYQDFAAGVITGTSVTITANSNGTGAAFSNFINYASIYRSDSDDYVYTTGFLGMFAGLVAVSSQSGASITLNRIPAATTPVRIWWLYTGIRPGEGYILPPANVLDAAATIKLDTLFVSEADIGVSVMAYSTNPTSSLLFLGSANGATPSWQVIPTQGQLIYYWTNTASSIATYYQQTADPFATLNSISNASVTNGQLLATFATNVSNPNLAFLPAGEYSNHIHAAKTAGTKDAYIRTEIWEVNSSGVDIAKIADCGPSVILTGVNAEYIVAQSNLQYTFASTSSRIITKVYAVVSGGGSAPTIVLYMGAASDSRTSLPGPVANITNFLPYTGAVSNTNTGVFTITSAGFIGPLTGNASTATLASTVTTNANLTGDVTSVGNATTIGALKVVNSMIANSSIDLTTKVTGLLPLANGGANADLSAFTAGSILFKGASALAQDNANLFWDDTNNRLILGAATSYDPTSRLVVRQDWDGSIYYRPQFQIGGRTNINQQINIGYNTTGDFGIIQPVLAGSAFKDLCLNPLGANVTIGTTISRQRLTIGAATPFSTTTPECIDMGGTFSSVAGTNLKFKTYNDGSVEYGFGVEANNAMYCVPSGANHRFYINGVSRFFISNNTVNIQSTTASTSNATGALLIAGGIGISNTTDATSSTNGGTITTAGGLAVAKKAFIGGNLNLPALTASTALALDGSKNVISVTNTGTGNNVLATSPVLTTPNLGTPSALVGTNITGTAASLTAGTATVANTVSTVDEAVDTTCFLLFVTASGTQSLQPKNNAGLTYNSSTNNLSATTFTGALTGNASTATLASTVTTNANLTGEVTSVGNAATLTNSAVIGKVLTGYVSGAGTVSATDSILQAIQKLNGNISGYTLQQGYNASASILTSTANGALTIQRGSATDSDRVLAILNGSGATTANITGTGVITGVNLISATRATSGDVVVSAVSTVSTNAGSDAIVEARTATGGGSPMLSLDNTNSFSFGIDTADGNKVKMTRSFRSLSSTSYFTMDTSGNITLSGTTATAALTTSGLITANAGLTIGGSSQSLNLSSATSNTIIYGTAGLGDPTFTTRSVGTKVVLYPLVAGASVDYAIGMGGSYIWQSVPQNVSSNSFRWFGGTTQVASLDGTGALTLVNRVSQKEYFVSCYNNGTQSIPNSTHTAITFGTDLANTNFGTRSPTDKFTPPLAGYWLVSYTVWIYTNSTGDRSSFIQINGNINDEYGAINTRSSVGGAVAMSSSAVVYFNGTTDYANIMVFQDSGVSLTSGAATPSYLRNSCSFHFLHS